jgi:type III restriction/modification enzyme restriction subunit/type I restriction modification DNA specificity protein
MGMNERDTLHQRIDPLLFEAGWNNTDILRERQFVYQERTIRPDYVLTYQLYPLAVLEIERASTPPETTVEQVYMYAESIGVPFIYIISATSLTITEIETKGGRITVRKNLPGPNELLELVGLNKDQQDPRLYAPFDKEFHPLNHIIAVSRALDAVLNGNKRILISTPIGTGITKIGFHIAWKLIKSGYCRRMLLLSETLNILHQTQQVYAPLDSNAPLLSGNNAEEVRISSQSSHNVHLGSVNYLLNPVKSPRVNDVSPDYYDLIIVQYLEEVGFKRLLKFAEYFSNAIFIALSSGMGKRAEYLSFFGSPVYQYSLEEVFETEELQPPKGFYAVQLSDIAEIQTGVQRSRIEFDSNIGTERMFIINARDIQPDGNIIFNEATKITIDESTNFNSKDATIDQYLLQPKDILLTSIGTNIKTAFIPTDLANKAIFSSSLTRLRIKSSVVDPQDVYQFIKSDIGQRALRRLTRGTAQSYISIKDLRQLLVFLPSQEAVKESSEELSSIARALNRIKNEILPQLEKAEQNRQLTSNEKSEKQPEDQQMEAYNYGLGEVAVLLRQVAATLVPPSLSERVLNDYPTPIALTYRRFLDARFNVYEKVLRLKDLFEAIAFFVYNIILIDVLRRLDVEKYYIEDKGARKAYNGYSMATRMEFVGQILNIARTNNGEDLFLPELIDSDVIDQAKQLQDELRNPLSHTATATESRLSSLLKDFQPIVEGMLDQLEFLTRYRLARIPSFYYQRGQLIRRMEVYRGPVYGLDEQELLDETKLTQADHNHLVLLDPDDQVLDCYPFYQLLANEDTRHETHLCFFKQRKAGEGRLEGESVQGAFGVSLDGFEEFDLLLRRFSDNNA